MDTIQLFFLESARSPLEEMLKTFKLQGDYGDTKVYPSYNPERILTAQLDVGELTKIKKPQRPRGGEDSHPEKRRRFALGEVRAYSNDLGLNNVPFVHIDNHPAFREGIRFTYNKKEAVKAKGGRTTDEKYGYARYEFVTYGRGIFAPVQHSFPTYAQGPALVSTLGDEKEIPLVLYMTQKNRPNSSLVDATDLSLKFDVLIKALIDTGRTCSSKGGIRTAFEDGIKYSEMILRIIPEERSRVNITMRRRFLVNLGLCYEGLRQKTKAVDAYSGALEYTDAFFEVTPLEKADIGFAKSAIERLSK